MQMAEGKMTTGQTIKYKTLFIELMMEPHVRI